MRKTFDININKIRRIAMKLLLKRKKLLPSYFLCLGV